jgi:hypothetical protein
LAGVEGFSAFGSAAGFGAGLAAPGLGAAAGFAAASGLADAAAPGLGAEAGFAACLGAASAAGLAPPGKAVRSFFTTGGSMVDEAERTNSPISSNLVIASLEVIPSSLASSWTRTLATFLLLWPVS